MKTVVEAIISNQLITWIKETELMEDSTHPQFQGKKDKKMLSLFVPEGEMDNAVLVENKINNSVKVEERNLLFIPRERKVYQPLWEEMAKFEQNWQNDSTHDVLRSMKKRTLIELRLLIGVGMIDFALFLMERNAISFAEAISRVQWNSDMDTKLDWNRNFQRLAYFAERGRGALSRSAPSQTLFRTSTHNNGMENVLKWQSLAPCNWMFVRNHAFQPSI